MTHTERKLTAAEREARAAEAMRENLRRRKAQQQARAGTAKTTVGPAAQATKTNSKEDDNACP